MNTIISVIHTLVKTHEHGAIEVGRGASGAADSGLDWRYHFPGCGRFSCRCPLEKEFAMSPTKAVPKPQAAIRRFDIFAEYKRQEAIRDGQAADVAKGYGLWVAKIVAARRFGKVKPDGEGGASQKKPAHRGKWHKLDEQPQTDKLFDKEIEIGRAHV